MHSAIKLTLWRYYLWNHKFARALNQWHFRWEFNASQFHFVLMMDWLCAWKAIQCEKSENEIETELNPYKLPSSSLCSRRSAAACPFGGIHAERKQQKCCIFIYTTEKLNVELLSLWVCVRCAHGFFLCVCFCFFVFPLIGLLVTAATMQSAKAYPPIAVNLWYLRRKAAHQHYVDLCTHYFSLSF